MRRVSFIRLFALYALFVWCLTPFASGVAHTYAHDPDMLPVVHAGDLVIYAPWTRQPPPSARTAAAYLVIENRGDAPDILRGGYSPVAKKVEVHTMSVTDGLMRMAPLSDGLVIKAGEKVTLKPGGLHLMLMGLQSSFKKGEFIDITLQFERAGSVTVQALTAKIGAKTSPHEPDHSSHSGHKSDSDHTHHR